jgi:hypothetical protein
MNSVIEEDDSDGELCMLDVDSRIQQSEMLEECLLVRASCGGAETLLNF